MSTPQRRRKDREVSQRAATAVHMSVATREAPEQMEQFGIELTHEDIARRAYHLFEARGGEHGFDLDDWLKAERELRQERAFARLRSKVEYALA